MATCNICKRELDTDDPLTRDCGGDCLKCMARVGDDPDCIPEVFFRLGFRYGVYTEGGGSRQHWSPSMKGAEDAVWEVVQQKGQEP